MPIELFSENIVDKAQVDFLLDEIQTVVSENGFAPILLIFF